MRISKLNKGEIFKFEDKLFMKVENGTDCTWGDEGFLVVKLEGQEAGELLYFPDDVSIEFVCKDASRLYLAKMWKAMDL